MPRTEQQKCTMAPLSVKFGEKDYDIKPLRVKKQAAWRQKLQETMEPIVSELNLVVVNNRTFAAGLSAALRAFPDKVLGMIFEYAPYLPQDEILNDDSGATEEQIAYAFSQIFDLVYQDFLAQLGTVNQMLKPAPQQQPAASTN
jgi:hypothetical protein